VKYQIDELVGKRIAQVRKERNMGQDDVARRLGCTKQKIHTIEAGETLIKLAECIEIAGILKVSPWMLLHDIGELRDLRGFLNPYFGDLAERDQAFVDEVMATIRWFERRALTRSGIYHHPIYYRPGCVLEFDEGWRQGAGDEKHLLVQRDKGNVRGYVFSEDIIPSESLDSQDRPGYHEIEEWSSEDSYHSYLRQYGYCYRTWPNRAHFAKFCRGDHAGVKEHRHDASAWER
jgi:transcriptional regulator with XRE-family HTH domain